LDAQVRGLLQHRTPPQWHRLVAARGGGRAARRRRGSRPARGCSMQPTPARRSALCVGVRLRRWCQRRWGSTCPTPALLRRQRRQQPPCRRWPRRQGGNSASGPLTPGAPSASLGRRRPVWSPQRTHHNSPPESVQRVLTHSAGDNRMSEEPTARRNPYSDIAPALGDYSDDEGSIPDR
jgi:hypothetical protein